MNERDFAIAFISALIASAVVGMIVYCATNDAWRKEAINRGYGEFNRTTGEWIWK